jgi:hypothetical protein
LLLLLLLKSEKSRLYNHTLSVYHQTVQFLSFFLFPPFLSCNVHHISMPIDIFSVKM